MQLEIDQLPGTWVVVDTGSRFISYNDEFSKLIGAEPKDRSYIGKTISDVSVYAEQEPGYYYESDKIICKEKKSLTILNINKYGDGVWRYLQINKKPILDDEGNVQNIVYNIVDHSDINLTDIGLIFTLDKNLIANLKDDYVRINDYAMTQDFKVNKKEAEILFFLLRGTGYKEIAQIQNISYRTVCDHIERLKRKFSANTTKELIYNAVLLGYPKAIPQHIFDKPLSIILHRNNH